MNPGRDEPVKAAGGRDTIAVKVVGNRRLAENTFEIRFERPDGFEFLAGQKIGILHGDLYRDYSLISSRIGSDLAICVRRVADGAFSPVLTGSQKGDPFHITPAFGYFLYQSSERTAVFVATGTGIAPFVAYAHDGARDYYLLHGVRSKADLYYRDILAPAARAYTPCLSGPEDNHSEDKTHFYGRVTDYLEHRLPQGKYDFYLCGRGEMLRDATRIIDQRFDGARVFSELFF